MTPTDEYGHQHGRRCYWDHVRCGWVCAAPPPVEVRIVQTGAGPVGVPVVAGEPTPAVVVPGEATPVVPA